MNFYAHIPEDFNLDVATFGNIIGACQGPTKYVGSIARLIGTGPQSTIDIRKVRSDTLEMKTNDGAISVGSYIEAQYLDLESQGGAISIGKRIGLNKKGTIKQHSTKPFYVSSVFSNMAELPQKFTFRQFGFDFENEYK